MRELGIVVGILLLLLFISLAGSTFGAEIIEVGMAVSVGSLALGVPLEIVYFGMLGVALSPGPPRGWYWRSFAHHHLLTPTQRWWVLPFFYIGAICFLVATLGTVLVVVGAISAVRSL